MWSKPPQNVPLWGTNPEMSILSYLPSTVLTVGQRTNKIKCFWFSQLHFSRAIQYEMAALHIELCG